MGDWLELQTQSNLQYVYIPERSGAVKLRVRAANDAHIALTNGPSERSPITEIRIGGWNNTKSTIRRDQTQPDKVEVLTRDILNRFEYVSFWIQWYDNKVSVGLKGQPAFIKFKDPDPHPITHFAVRTGWGATGHWKIEVSPTLFQSLRVKPIKTGELRWVTKTIDDDVPQDALIGGYENGEVLYIGRTMQRGSMLPGKYVPSMGCLVVGWGRVLTEYYTCEMLCGYNASWLKTSEGYIPPHSFQMGFEHTENDEPYYLGRAHIDGNLIPGKAFPNHKLCYLPYADTEVDMTSYEILVVPDKLPSAVIWRPESKREDYESDDEDLFD